jgi:hypothetical protein
VSRQSIKMRWPGPPEHDADDPLSGRAIMVKRREHSSIDGSDDDPAAMDVVKEVPGKAAAKIG